MFILFSVFPQEFGNICEYRGWLTYDTLYYYLDNILDKNKQVTGEIEMLFVF